MAELPFTVVSSHEQPPSGGSATARAIVRGRSQYVIFEGRLGSGSRLQKHTIEVLAGEAAPTPSAGYAKWARVQRPQRVSLTIHEGYEPLTLTVPVLFDAVRILDPSEREDIEFQIQKLEWMGGRGILYREPYRAGVGKPPLVRVFSQREPETPSQLVPKPFQVIKGTEGQPLFWYVEDITFDEHPLRDRGGARLRQAAVVRLVEAVRDEAPVPGAPGPPYTVFRSTSTLYSVRRLVANYMSPFLRGKGELDVAVRKTIEINRGNKAIGTNPHKRLKNHTAVKIPNEFL